MPTIAANENANKCTKVFLDKSDGAELHPSVLHSSQNSVLIVLLCMGCSHFPGATNELWYPHARTIWRTPEFWSGKKVLKVKKKICNSCKLENSRWNSDGIHIFWLVFKK